MGDLAVNDAPGRPGERVEDRASSDTLSSPSLLALLVFGTLLGTYFVARSGGLWAESDTALITRWIRAVVATGTLSPSTGDLYPQGYGYAAVSAFVLALTGLDLTALQQVVYPLVSALLVLPAWALYRELTGSRRAATLATLLLFVQPEFLFVVMRGSHERMLRALMLITLWLLARSFRFREHPANFAAHVGLFYLAAYALVATNVLFGISFFAAIATAMLVAWALGRARPSLQSYAGPMAARLASVTLVAAGLGFIVVFYAYPLSRTSVRAFGTLVQKLGALYLTTQPSTVTAYNPYLAVANGWVSLPIYFLVSSGDYLLLLASAAVWIRQAGRWTRRARRRRLRPLGEWILWLLYGAFALQGMLAILSDRTGFLGGNLEHRSFPSFAMVAAPLLATTVSEWQPRLRTALLSGVVIALFTGLALVKATDEPSLSNNWTFYRRPEILALRWASRHSRHASIWTGPTNRLTTATSMDPALSTGDNQWDDYSPEAQTRTFIISRVTRLLSARLDIPLPDTSFEYLIYDSGDVRIFHLRARSPYQH